MSDRLKIRMTFYAIKHLPSGGFLPVKVPRRGNSFTEPTMIEPPRMFTNRRSASCALTAWLRGKWVQQSSQGYEDPYPETWYEPKPVESRRANEMEVVEVEVREV